MSRKFTQKDLESLRKLIQYSDRYEINIQFWPDQTAVYISKGGVDLQDYGGDFEYAINAGLSYLNKITKNTQL